MINQHQDLTFDNLFEFRVLSALKFEEAEELEPGPKKRTMKVSKFAVELLLKQASGTFGDINNREQQQLDKDACLLSGDSEGKDKIFASPDLSA
jgi:hypothetical protein